MPRILLKERGAFGNADTGGAWLSSARATAGDKPEEGEDDVKSSCPLCPGRHTCYNGGLRVAMRGHTAVNAVPGPCTHARHHYGSGLARSRYLNAGGGCEGGLGTGVKCNKVPYWKVRSDHSFSGRRLMLVVSKGTSSCAYYLRSEQLIGSTFSSPCPCVAHGGEKRKERDGVSLALDVGPPSYFTKTCHGKEEGGNRHTWRAQYNGELIDDLLRAGLWFKSRMAQLAREKKRKKRLTFMHAPLGSGGYSSVGRAPLLQLGRCDYGLDV
ncbi:hypothetical protein Tco_0881171 [Tanacetum coccineum]